MTYNFRQMKRLFFVMLVLCMCLSSAAIAQEITGSLNGTVKDGSGASVAGATVTITDPSKNNQTVRTLTTSDDGEFSAPNLQVGTYQVTVEASNFKKSVQTAVKLDVGQRRTVDFALEAGNISETVTVEADPVAVELTTPTASTLITGNQVRELSLNNRNFIQLVTLAPGVTNDLDDVVNTGTNNPDTQVVNRTLISVNGARATQNTFTVDGADITDRGSNLTIQSYPSVDSIGEFKVLRSLYPAESGRSGGGQVNIVTRSGTDQFHGSLFEFVRNEKFNANNNNSATLTTANLNSLVALYGRDSNGKLNRKPFRYNNYGFTVGGPVFGPNFGEGGSNNLFRKYSKTYFFFSEEQRRDIRYPTLGPTFVPDAGLKQGVFPIAICLSATTTCTSTLPAGTPLSSVVATSATARQYVNNIFNQIPNSSASAGYLLSYPDRNVANFRQEIIKIDHQFSKSVSAFYRYERDKIPTQDADGTIGGRSGIPFVNRTESDSPGRTHTAQVTYVVNPHFIVEGSYAYGFGAIYIDTTGLLAKQNGLVTAPLPYTSLRDIVPTLAIGGSFGSLTGFSNYVDPSSKQNYSGSATYISGNHTMKFGGIVSRYMKMENAISGANSGAFSTFNNSATSGSVLATGVANTTINQSLQRFANFLQGNLVTFSQAALDLTANFRQKSFEGYAQDEWKYRPNLTLYYGVRYSFFDSPTDKNGQLSNFDPALFVASQAPQVTGAANRVAGTGNFCNGLIVNAQNYQTGPASFNCTPTASPYGEHVYKVSRKDFAPRVGLAWDPFGKGTTAVRTGYGIYHEQIPIGAVENFLINPPYQTTCTVTNVAFDNPVPGGNCTVAAAATVASLRGITPNFKTPYMQHWSLDVQHQFGKSTVVSVGYYGSKGTHLIGFTELNDLPVGTALNSQCATGNFTLQTAPAGTTVRCLTPGTGLFSATTANTQIDQIRPYRGYRSLSILESRYNSNYHSLQASATQRFTGNSQVQLAYTFSKNLTDNQTSVGSVAPQDTYNIAAERGRAALDRKHVFSANIVYELPFYAKQEGLTGKVLGGFQVSSIISYGSGLPLTITTSGFDAAGLGFINALVAGGRPNVLCDPNSNAPRTVAQYFNTSCFQLNPASNATNIVNTPGNAGRGILNAPAQKRFDLTLAKNIRFGESYRIQLRAEAFNVLNFTNFRTIGTNVTLTTYGQVTSFRDPRTIQLGAKFYF